MRSIKALSFFLCFCISAFAEVKWDQKELEFKASVQDTNTVARFTFTYTGKKPLTILSLKASCSCTTITSDKDIYQDGESGTITANFAFGKRVGLQEKTVFVETDESRTSHSVMILNFKVFIPEPTSFQPSLVYWQQGEKVSTKTITIRMADGIPIHVLKIHSTSNCIQTEMVTVQDGKEYLLHITPVDTSKPSWSTILIETDFPKEEPHSFQVYAQIKS